MIYDKYNHLCPFDNGLLEKGTDLFFSGYVKAIDNEDTSINDGVLVKNAGPIKEWQVTMFVLFLINFDLKNILFLLTQNIYSIKNNLSDITIQHPLRWIYGFDGGEKSLIGLCTERALYYLMEPSSIYENVFQNIQLKSKLSKIVIEFLLDFGYQNPTFEDLIQHLKNFDLPEVEELLFREAQFLCNQVNQSYIYIVDQFAIWYQTYSFRSSVMMRRQLTTRCQ